MIFSTGENESGPGGLEGFYRRNTAFKTSIFYLTVVIC
jgi:hypothetical protein